MSQVSARVASLRSIRPLLQVKDLDESVLFYVESLGFQLVEYEEGGFAMVSRDQCTLFLAQKQRDVDLRNQTARAQLDGYACYDLHFHCERGTIDELWREYRQAGVKMPSCFDDGPINRPYGIRDFSLYDPDGYDLVFGAPFDSASG